MSETLDIAPPRGMGLTERQRQALATITALAAATGRMPSRSELATAMGCNKNNANRLIECLVERGELAASDPHGPLAGFGDKAGGHAIAVYVPREIVQALATYCANTGERVAAVASDAITLHLDQVGGQ